MKKLTALFLCLLMIVPLSLFGCNDGEDETTAAVVTGVAEQRLELEVPEVSFDSDYEFDIIGQGGDGWTASDIICPEEDSDDVLIHARYARYKAVEEKYGIKINTTLKDSIYTIVSGSLSSDDKSFDLIFMDTYTTSSAAAGDLLLNLYNVDSINLDSPWYDRNYTEGMSIGSTIYSSVNDMTTMDMHCTWIMMYNKDLIAKYGLEDPYDMVKNNTWTFDNFVKMLENVSTDNGDGVWDKEDTYAFAAHQGSARNFFYGAGMTICGKDEANYPEIVVGDNENVVKLQEKIVTLLHSGNTTLFGDGITDAFLDGRALFLAEITGYANTKFRDMEDDFGIVPYPKYNSSQKDYYTTNDPCIMVMSIPDFNYSETELDQIGTVIETLCWESYYTVRPAYYEQTLAGKATRDEESYEMLDLCRNSRLYDFGLFNPDISLHNAFQKLIANDSTPYSSTIKRHIKDATQELNDIIAKYDKAN